MTARFSQNFWPELSHNVPSLPHVANSVEWPSEFLGELEFSPLGAPEDENCAEPDDDASHLASPSQVAIYVPEHYESKYAYPLILWLHPQGSSERDLLRVMPQISPRNYFGLALRGTVRSRSVDFNPYEANDKSPGGFRWSQSQSDLVSLERNVSDAARDLRRRFHIHSERIYTAGFGDGATTALSLLLRRPEWFAGAIALGGPFPATQTPLRRFRDLHGKRVLMGTGARDTHMPISELVRTGRLLHSSGIDVSTRIYDAAHAVVPSMLEDANQWIMSAVTSASHA